MLSHLHPDQIDGGQAIVIDNDVPYRTSDIDPAGPDDQSIRIKSVVNM